MKCYTLLDRNSEQVYQSFDVQIQPQTSQKKAHQSTQVNIRPCLQQCLSYGNIKVSVHASQ